MQNSQNGDNHPVSSETSSKIQKKNLKENPQKKEAPEYESTLTKLNEIKMQTKHTQKLVKAMDVPQESVQIKSQKYSEDKNLNGKQKHKISRQNKKEYLNSSSSQQNETENIKSSNRGDVKHRIMAIKSINKKMVADARSYQIQSKIGEIKYSPQNYQYQKPKVSEQAKKIEQKGKSKIKKQQVQYVERVPCSFCDKLITFAQMDDHHDNCQMAFRCENCRDIFLLVTLEDHYRICNKKKKHQQPKKDNNYQKKLSKPVKSYDKKPKQKEHHKKQKVNFIDDQQQFQNQVILKHPDISAKYLREHLLAEKQNKYKKQHKQQEHEDDIAYDNSQPYYQSNSDDQYYNEPSYNSYQSNYSSIHTPKIQGLKTYQIDRLISDVYHKSDNNQEEQCNICTKQKENGQFIIRLPCFHTFHADCLVPWLQVKSTCPTCKFNLKSI